MLRLLGASIAVLVAMLGLIFAIGLLVITRLHLPMGITLALTAAFSVAVVLLQYCLGPMFIDWIVKVRWTHASELGGDFAQWTQSTCNTFKIPEPKFGIIEEAAPNAFTYGHGAYDARVVVTRGLIDVLSPEELKAVVAHELGHIKHRDFIVMTLVQALVLVLYSLYIASRAGNGRNGWYVVIAAYISYWLAYYASLLLSRIREYMADYASAQITGNPNHLSYALVKIAYGLAKTQTVGGATVPVAARTAPAAVPAGGVYDYSAEAQAKLKAQLQGTWQSDNAAAIAARLQPAPAVQDNKTKQTFSAAQLGAFGVMGAASMRCAVAWAGADGLANPDSFTSAAKWELFNPWSKLAELFSTHPLTAHRIKALQKLNRLFGQADAFDFSKIRPVKYKGMAKDLLVLVLPLLGLAISGGLAWLSMGSTGHFGFKQVLMLVLGLLVGRLLQMIFTYVGGYTPSQVFRCLGEVQVSHLNPNPVAFEGVFTGRISPGIAWASDFILQDDTGFISCLYRQPIGLMDLWFGLTAAERFVGRRVRVYGWYRRFQAPYLEMSYFQDMQTGEKVRCWYMPVTAILLVLACAACVVGMIALS